VLAIAYAAVSAYWALGGTALLDTVGGSIERIGRDDGIGAKLGLWAIVVAKLVAAAVPIVAIGWRRVTRRDRVVRRLAQLEAVVLTLYGLVQTAVGLLVQAGVVSAGAHADRRALRWHAFLWDPWFLVWGLAVTIALIAARPGRHATVTAATIRR
jgi:hypothetical protein